MNKTLSVILFSFWVLALLGPGGAQAALLFNTNVIVNPGTELGFASLTNNVTMPVPGWTNIVGNFTAVQYRTPPQPLPGVPTLTDPGPADRGLNLFAGGSNGNPEGFSLSSGDQILDISNAAAIIDTGSVPFSLSAFLGGYLDQRDNAVFSAIFEDASMAALGTSTIGPVFLGERFDAIAGHTVTGLFFRSANGFIPAGTRQIDFHLVMNGIDGAQNDGYADNLSFIASAQVSAVPEPGSMGLLAIGLCGFSFCLRRRRVT